MDKEDLDDALRIATELMNKNPRNAYGEQTLGFINKDMGALASAEKHFARAYELFPSEDNEKNLTAIRKALEPLRTSR